MEHPMRTEAVGFGGSPLTSETRETPKDEFRSWILKPKKIGGFLLGYPQLSSIFGKDFCSWIFLQVSHFDHFGVRLF